MKQLNNVDVTAVVVGPGRDYFDDEAAGKWSVETVIPQENILEAIFISYVLFLVKPASSFHFLDFFCRTVEQVCPCLAPYLVLQTVLATERFSYDKQP